MPPAVRPGICRAIWVLLTFAACQAYTTRPRFAPMPDAATTQVLLDVPEATKALAEALRADSIPVRRVVERDGMIESDWFEVPGFQVTRRRPLGQSVVMVRAWVDMGQPGHSLYNVETVYRVAADPSRPDRELEASVPASNPAQVKVRLALRGLLLKHGSSEDIRADSIAQRQLQAAQQKPPAPVAKGDSAKAAAPGPTKAVPDTTRARPDTTRMKPDTTRTRPDTTLTPRKPGPTAPTG
jgi:hypothetical protein